MKFTLASLQAGVSPLRDAVLFLGLTFALSWLLWIPGGFLVLFGAVDAGNFMLAIGSMVPLGVAIYLDLWARRSMMDWLGWFKTLTLRNVMVAVILPFLILLPIILYRLYNQSFDPVRFLADFGDAPSLFVGLLILAFAEEAGWRGFLLPRISSLNLFLVNFIMAFAWFAWQLPVILATPNDAFLNDMGQQLAAYLLFSILITPFFNRLALHANMNVLLPTLFRACLKTTFAVYVLQGGLNMLTHPIGMAGLGWLAALNLLLFGQLWQGKPSGEESELERVMPLESAVR